MKYLNKEPVLVSLVRTGNTALHCYSEIVEQGTSTGVLSTHWEHGIVIARYPNKEPSIGVFSMHWEHGIVIARYLNKEPVLVSLVRTGNITLL